MFEHSSLGPMVPAADAAPPSMNLSDAEAEALTQGMVQFPSVILFCIHASSLFMHAGTGLRSPPLETNMLLITPNHTQQRAVHASTALLPRIEAGTFY